MENKEKFKKIIGFHGAAFSGKDTAATIIKNCYKNTDIFAFAGPLKDACEILFNFKHEQLHDQILKETIDERWNKSPREIMQWLGTDILRNHINQNFFIMNMNQRIENSQADYIIVSDIRFDNEAEFIKSLGGKIIKIERKNSSTTKHSNHITERGISPHLLDAVVLNDGTIEQFKTNILLALRFLKIN